MERAMGKLGEKLVKRKVRRAVDRFDSDTDAEDHRRDDESPEDYASDSPRAPLKSKVSRAFGKLKRPRVPASSSDDDLRRGDYDRLAESSPSAGTVATETPVQSSDGASTDWDSDERDAGTDGESAYSVASGYSNSTVADLRRKRRKNLAAEDDDVVENEVEADSGAKRDFTVRVRVIEAQGLQGTELNPLVRVCLDGKSRTTRTIRCTDSPKWDQLLTFPLKRSIEDLSQKNIEFNVYSARKIVKDSLIGCFSLNLGLLYKQRKHSVCEKWVVLNSGPSDDDDPSMNDGDIRGYLKISACVFGSHEHPPPMRVVGRNKNEDHYVLSNAHLLSYLLKVRLYKLCKLSDVVRFRKDVLVGVEIECGRFREHSSFHPAAESVYFNEEIGIPIAWPTVIKQIRFRILSRKKGSRGTVVCTQFLPLSQLTKPGDKGFLPTYGPSFISFYGPELDAKWSSREMKAIRDGEFEGANFCGRLLLDVSCDEVHRDRTYSAPVSASAAAAAEELHLQRNYTLFASTFSANRIHPDFKSSNVKFVVSMGEFGNRYYEGVLSCTSSTLAVMPAFDTCRYYAMPYGNRKPVCELVTTWEDITHRMAQSNAIHRVADLLEQCQQEAMLRSGSSIERSDTASVIVEALEEATAALHVITMSCRYQSLESEMPTTALDTLLQESRFEAIRRLVHGEFSTFKYDIFDGYEINDMAVEQLGLFAASLRHLATDPQLSVPDVIVQMLVNGKVEAYARIPAADILFHRNELKRGRFVGKITPIYLKWPTRRAVRYRGDDLPGVLHMKLWFGPTSKRSKWLRSIRPANMKYYAEFFHNQYRTLLANNWRDTTVSISNNTGVVKSPYPKSDESGEVRMEQGSVFPPHGWRFSGDWTNVRSHDMWVGADVGRHTYEDEYFEVEQREDTRNQWNAFMKSSRYGDQIDENHLAEAPPGWTYVNEWSVDLHCIGDAEGWSYALENKFDDPALVETDERQTHTFRRRRYKRLRRLIDSSTVTQRLDDHQLILKHPKGYEYAQKWGEPVHIGELRGDSFRRMRMVRELTPRGNTNFNYKLAMSIRTDHQGDAEAANQGSFVYMSPRIYNVHDQVCEFELRVCIVWGRELLLPQKSVAGAFVRASFLNRCQETHIVKNSACSPIFNETLIFQKVIVPGGIDSIRRFPPSVLIEVFGTNSVESEIFLGRFDLTPTVINSPLDQRAVLKWYNLKLRDDRGRGSLLLLAELFQADKQFRALIPLLPARKKNLTTRFEVEPSLRPEFSSYTVQFLCWGVRNLSRYQLRAVRSPFIEITVGNAQDRTDVIEDAKKNPNFPHPLMTFPDVQLPNTLYYAAPIALNLHDKRFFGIKPLIGTCTIKNIAKYMSAPPKPKTSANDPAWTDFDNVIRGELIRERRERKAFLESDRTFEDESQDDDNPNRPKIDWWCKYYASRGDNDKAPGYLNMGLEKLVIFRTALEDARDYCGFQDFLDTFPFRKPNRNTLDHILSDDIRGELKGKLFIIKNDESGSKRQVASPPGVEFNGDSVPCLLRVYVVRAFDLTSRRRSGICDPYVMVRCGNSKKLKMEKEYRPDTLEPTFGQMFELDIDIPQQKDLTISVLDKRYLIADEEIGSTTIDLENRLLTKYRATVGLPTQYNLYGPLPWRDQISPLETLKRYCRKMHYAAPKVVTSKDKSDVGIEFLGVTFWHSRVEPTPPKNAHQLGRPLQRVALFVLRSIGLVPEHIETRPLYNSVNPSMECGKLEVFVDLFPKVVGPIPPPLDISPRRPVPYQLRVVIWRAHNVILSKRSMGKPAADLYATCCLNGAVKAEKTDIHFRSLDGTASWNWRFVIDFDYDAWEQMIKVYKGQRLFRKKNESLVDPILVIQIWDNNKFKKDKHIGEYRLKLLGFEEGQMDPEDMGNVFYAKEKEYCCCNCCISMCVCCYKCCCSKKKRKKKLVELPRAPLYIENKEIALRSIFEQKSVSGWWPMLSTELPDEQKMIVLDRKKKDDDYQDDQKYVTGLVEMEVALVTAAEAKRDPVGKKRKKPNHSPRLPKPDRPTMDSYWCTSRLKAGSAFCWKKCGWQFICITLCVLLLVLIIVSVIYNFPEIVFGTLKFMFKK